MYFIKGENLVPSSPLSLLPPTPKQIGIVSLKFVSLQKNLTYKWLSHNSAD